MQPNVHIEKPSTVEGFLFEGSQGKGNGYGLEKFIGRALVLWGSSVAPACRQAGRTLQGLFVDEQIHFCTQSRKGF